MKSHAVFSLGCGMPGVSGELNVHGVPTRPRLANEPGVVPAAVLDGLSPSGGRTHSWDASVVEITSSAAFVGRTIAHGSLATLQKDQAGNGLRQVGGQNGAAQTRCVASRRAPFASLRRCEPDQVPRVCSQTTLTHAG